MVEPGQANFIGRDVLLQFLRENGEIAVRLAEQLSRNYYSAIEEVRMLGLASSPSEKLAKLLLPGRGTRQSRLILRTLKCLSPTKKLPRSSGPRGRRSAPVLRVQEEATAAIEGRNPDHPQQTCLGENDALLRAGVIFPALLGLLKPAKRDAPQVPAAHHVVSTAHQEEENKPHSRWEAPLSNLVPV